MNCILCRNVVVLQNKLTDNIEDRLLGLVMKVFFLKKWDDFASIVLIEN
jgi:hypothetical protein